MWRVITLRDLSNHDIWPHITCMCFFVNCVRVWSIKFLSNQIKSSNTWVEEICVTNLIEWLNIPLLLLLLAKPTDYVADNWPFLVSKPCLQYFLSFEPTWAFWNSLVLEPIQENWKMEICFIVWLSKKPATKSTKYLWHY